MSNDAPGVRSGQSMIRSAFGRYAVALGCVLVAFGVRFLLTPILGGSHPWIVFIPAAMCAAWWGGTGPALGALVLGLLLGDYFFVPPFYSFGPVSLRDVAGLVLYAGAGAVAIVVTRNLRSSRYLARKLQHQIRERGRAEEDLRANEARLRLILESAKDYAIVALDQEGRVASWNAGAESVFGYSESEIMGQSGAVTFTPEDQANHQLEKEITAATQLGCVEHECWQQRKDGRRIFVRGRICPIRNEREHHRPTGFIEIARDVTERKRIEAELAASEERYRRIVEMAAEGIWSLDEEGRTVYVNRRMAQMLGYPMDEMLGRPILDFVPEEDLPAARDQWERRRRGEEIENESRFRRRDGSDLWARWAATLIYDDQGGVAGAFAMMTDITGQMQAQQALKASEQLAQRHLAELDAVIQSMPDAVYVGNQSGITRCNKVALKILGVASIEELQQRIHELGAKFNVRSAEDHHLLAENELQFMRALHGEVAVEEVLAKRADTGEEVYVRAASAPIMQSGQIIGAVAVNTDITHQKRVEQALREREEHLRLILENVKDHAIFSIDSEARITSWNPGAERVFGYSEAEILGQSFAVLFTPEDRAAGAPEQELTGAAVGDFAPDDRWHLRKDGTRFFVTGTVRLIQDEFGRRRGYIKVARDVTARKLVQDQLEARLRQQATVVELGKLALTGGDEQVLMDESVALVARTLGIEFCKILELIPTEPDMLLRAGVGWKPNEVGHARVRTGQGSQAGFTLDSEAPVISDDLAAEGRFEVLPLLKEHGVRSSVTVLINGHLTGEGHSFGVLGACSTQVKKFNPDDVNFLQSVANLLSAAIERKRTEATLKEAQQRLSDYALVLEQRVAERTANLEMTIQSLEGVCYHVAHDLRAPLRAMQGFTTLLLSNYARDLDAAGEDFAQRISAAATRMDRLIGDLLDYGRLSHVQVSVSNLDLKKHIEWVLVQLREEVQARSAEVRVDYPLPKVWASATVLEQILTNLLTNALKYVSPGATPRIHIWTETKGSSVRIWIEDNGIGIAPEHQERIFRVFERLHAAENYPGTGIGLAIVAKGAERMGGRVGVESNPGEGSRFWLELPRARRSK